MKSHAFTLLGLVTIVLWSLSPSIVDEIKELPPFEISAIVLSISFFTSLIGLKKSSFAAINSVPLHSWGIKAACIAVNQIAYVTAFKFLMPHEVEIIYYLWPCLLLLLVTLKGGERFSFSHVVAFGICLLGVYCVGDVSGETAFGDIRGYCYAIVAALAWAFFSYYAKTESRYFSGLIGLLCGPGALLSAFLHLYCEEANSVTPSLKQMMLMIGQGVIILNVSIELWHKALQKGNFRVLSIAPYLVPILSILLLIIFHKTVITSQLIGGALLVSLGCSVRCFSDSCSVQGMVCYYHSACSNLGVVYHREKGILSRTVTLLVSLGSIA